MIDTSKMTLRWAFAALSLALGAGCFTLTLRADTSGQAGALALITVALIVNGLLVKPSRRT